MPLNHCGTQTIETERLVLRRYRESDAQDVFDNWASDPEVTKHLTWKPHDNVEATCDIVNKWVESYDNPEFYLWVIARKGTDMPIGAIDMRHCEGHKTCCLIGYCLSSKYWSRGIMTEATRAVIHFGFDTVGFERIQSYHHVENPASGRVMQKSGMLHEGTLRKYGVRNDGGLSDCEMYAIIKDDLNK